MEKSKEKEIKNNQDIQSIEQFLFIAKDLIDLKEIEKETEKFVKKWKNLNEEEQILWLLKNLYKEYLILDRINGLVFKNPLLEIIMQYIKERGELLVRMSNTLKAYLDKKAKTKEEEIVNSLVIFLKEFSSELIKNIRTRLERYGLEKNIIKNFELELKGIVMEVLKRSIEKTPVLRKVIEKL